MRAPKNEAPETEGQSRVEADFQKIHWAPIPNAYHDLGTDLLISVRDARRFERGLVVGAQVKSGDSYFGKPEKDADEAITGWWYVENDVDHFDDWVLHPFPHLVVLHDLNTQTSYWVHVTADRIERTGKGCKILVPRSQTICPEQADALFDVAATQRRTMWSAQWNAFDSAAKRVQPGARLRYALLTPRLVSPHPNAGYDRELEPEEAIAILTRYNLFQYDQFVEKQRDRLEPAKLDNHRDWRWRLVNSYRLYLLTGNTNFIEQLIDNAPTLNEQAAVRIIVSTALIESERFRDALKLLEKSTDNDLPPVEYAWILVQRARVKAEIGKIPEARLDAASAARNLRGSMDDPTASLLSSSAAELLFSTWDYHTDSRAADESTGNTLDQVLRDTINAHDAAAAWGQGQTLASVLSGANKDTFQAWSGNEHTITLAHYDEADLHIRSMILVASLSGDHQGWCHLLAEASRYKLIRTTPTTPGQMIVYWLNALRRSGQDEDLERASKRMHVIGPIDVLREVVDAAQPASITRTTALSTLKLWRSAADVMSQSYANIAAKWCVEVIRNPTTAMEFRAQYRPNFVLWMFALDALVALLPVVDRVAQYDVAKLLPAFANSNTMIGQRIGELAWNIPAEVLRSANIDVLRAAALAQQDPQSKSVFLAALQRAGDVASATTLLDQATAGDWAAVAAVIEGPLSATQIDSVQAYLSRKADDIAAHPEKFSSGDPHAIAQLTIFAIVHKDEKAWSKLLSVFENTKLSINTIGQSLHILANRVGELPEGWLDGLRRALPAIQAQRVHHELLGPVSPGPKHLAIALEVDNQRQTHAVNALLAGNTHRERELAAVLIGRGFAPTSKPALHLLITDADPKVRQAAAFAIAKTCANDVAEWATAIKLIETNSGIDMPLAFLNGLSERTVALDPFLQSIVAKLKNHVSARVRAAATRLSL